MRRRAAQRMVAPVKVRMLGCGTSSGVPRIGNDWGACDPADPRNRRRRAAILVSQSETNVLVDSGPDLRDQLLDAGVATVDAVIWTHEHADHAHGLDDLRQLFHNAGTPIQGFASTRCLDSLTRRFSYVFAGKAGYPATVAGQALPETLNVGAVAVNHVEQPHGGITSTGLLFTCGGKRIGYSTDFSDLTEEMVTLFEGVDVWIIDALRKRPHPTHSHLASTLAAIERVRPGRAVLTHMDNSLDYASLRRELPPHIEPGYDGLEIIL